MADLQQLEEQIVGLSLLDAAQRTFWTERMCYAGGIDDGKTMNPNEVLAARNYVRPALEDILAGKAVRVATTEPFGCALAYAG